MQISLSWLFERSAYENLLDFTRDCQPINVLNALIEKASKPGAAHEGISHRPHRTTGSAHASDVMLLRDLYEFSAILTSNCELITIPDMNWNVSPNLLFQKLYRVLRIIPKILSKMS